MLNASASRYYRLVLDGLTLSLIATDGGRLAQPQPITELLLAPGERAEFLVAPTTPGTTKLRALPYNRSGPGMGGQLPSSNATVTVARLQVSGSAPAAALPTTLAAITDLRAASISKQRTVVLAMAMGMGGGSGGMGGGGMGGGALGDSLTIDGKSYDPSRPISLPA